jgi:hypothetical protein
VAFEGRSVGARCRCALAVHAFALKLGGSKGSVRRFWGPVSTYDPRTLTGGDFEKSGLNAAAAAEVRTAVSHPETRCAASSPTFFRGDHRRLNASPC